VKVHNAVFPLCAQEDLIRKILSKPFKIPIRDYKGMLHSVS